MRAFKSGLFLILLVALALPSPAAAWSRKGHILIIRSAVKLLADDPTTPPALRALLLEGLGDPAKLDSIAAFVLTEPYAKVAGPLDPGLDLFSYRPDDFTPQRSPVPIFDSTEDRMHYLNLERFHPDPDRRKYAPDGSNKPSLSALPRDWKDERYATGGFVTFRVEQAYDSLVRSLATDSSNEQIFLWMGFLSHYASDAFQPYHATLNYAGLLCPNQHREKADQYNTHGEFEETIFSDESPAIKPRVAVFWNQYKETLAAGAAKPVQRLDPYVSTQEALSGSYDLLPFLCRAREDAFKGPAFDRQAWFAHTEEIGGRRLSTPQLQAERMALATLAVRTLIRQAWDDATKIGNPPPVPPPPLPASVPPPRG